MKISRNLTRGCALALAVLLALPCVNLMQTKAAGPVIQDQKCKLTVEVNASALGEEASGEDFKAMTVPVNVYKVADVNVSAEFTSIAEFANLDFNIVMNKDTNAAAWEDLAKQAVKKLEGVAPTEIGQIINGAPAVIEGLDVGMYLVAPQETFNSNYSRKYVFQPYLTALPSSQYTQTGAGSDEWEYDRTISLKGEAEVQTGKLTIHKTLQNYNTTLGEMTCVFQIEGRDAAGDVVYSNVASITLDSADTRSVTIENIPAGLDVTVTEVYAGASYEVVGDNLQSTMIQSDASVKAGNSQASVSFTNQYGGGNRGGYGVTNAFTVGEDGEWGWTDPTASDNPPEN